LYAQHLFLFYHGLRKWVLMDKHDRELIGL
jgi:hypothetical protein